MRAAVRDRSSIQRFDSANYALFNTQVRPNGQLLLFMPGTAASARPRAFLGRRPMPATASFPWRITTTSRSPSFAHKDPIRLARARSAPAHLWRPNIGGRIRRQHTAESIVNRLVEAAAYLDRNHPDSGWGSYIENGAPAWQRIVVCGQSQGAGMAAFIAKQHAVARVILFSSPWDYVQRSGRQELAPWIALPSQTPPERWFGGYHARENMADLLGRSYAQLQIPQDHIRVFNNDLPAGNRPKGNNPVHGQGIFNQAYAEQRAFFIQAPAP